MGVRHIPDVEQWEPWSPLEVAERLARCPAPWGVAGGWALDLWREQETRRHGDIEIVIPSTSLRDVGECLQGYVFYAAKQGMLLEADLRGPMTAHQFWVLDPAAGKWRLDIMVDPGDDARWIYRRDARVQAPRSDMLACSRESVPYLRPQAVLLFKAKKPRPKDELDFLASLPLLSSSERDWLRRVLMAAHPESPWIESLAPRG